ncbi:MAG: winged helix-turn-helix transcriptional regulator [Sphingomonadales bacterium]|nr:winged helix-turn-helix transcriptional regulator [Sphingomonadales bacterium]
MSGRSSRLSRPEAINRRCPAPQISAAFFGSDDSVPAFSILQSSPIQPGDMLLDLMAARLEDEEVSVTSLCIASAGPSTTALRWLRNLIDVGLLWRRADPEDGRRVYISLTGPAARAMSAYLAAAKRQGGMII